MPYPFTLPTTGSVPLSDYFDSVTHPSLPLSTATRRGVVRDALKQYKRLAPQARVTRLPSIQDALTDYLAHLLTLNAGIGYRAAGPIKLDVQVCKPLEVEWRSTLSAAPPGREAPRVKLLGLHHEIAFVLSTLAYTHTLLARAQLRNLQGSSAVTGERRTAAIQAAMKHLSQAHAIHLYLLSLPSTPAAAAAHNSPIDIQPATVSGLAALALAEATLVVAAKDDPYAAAVADDRNQLNVEWMYKAPRIDQTRASLLVRVCVKAGEYAAEASGNFSSRGSAAGAGSNGSTSGGGGGSGGGGEKLDEAVGKYAENLRRTARGRAARFHAIEAEMSGRTGEALAWLKGARKELGLTVEVEDGRRKGLHGLKQSWQERREDRKVEKGGEWGLDAGRLEEARIVEMLEAKWEKENSIMNVQVVPPFEPLLATLPSGRAPFSSQPFVPPALDADTLAGMRAPPDPDEAAFRGNEDDSGAEDGQERSAPAGAFPGTEGEYARSATRTSYY